jgi:hypothetical protein
MASRADLLECIRWLGKVSRERRHNRKSQQSEPQHKHNKAWECPPRASSYGNFFVRSYAKKTRKINI